jgi:hypothetical protein
MPIHYFKVAEPTTAIPAVGLTTTFALPTAPFPPFSVSEPPGI